MRRLAREDQGAVAVYVGVTLAMMVGVGALAVDLGRFSTMDSQLEAAARAAAIAGARELDRLGGSQDRARAAAVQAVQNSQDFADGGAGVAISPTDCGQATDGASCIRFLSELPPSDSDPMSGATAATGDADSNFIEVRVARTTMPVFFAGLIGGPGSLAGTAYAVAGNDAVICEVPPMFMCNPLEDPAGGPLDWAALQGKQFRLFQQGGGGYIPGNFGLLCPLGTEGSTNCGAKSLAPSLASRSGTCLPRTEMTTKPGVTLQMVRTGINARFDYWTPQAKDGENGNWRFNDAFAPAVNVSQGSSLPASTQGGGTKCERDPVADETQALGPPRDDCFATGTCAEGRIGDGNWDVNKYLGVNHEYDGGTWPAGLPGAPTRYDVYRWEIESVGRPIVEPGQTVYDGAGTAVGSTTEHGHVKDGATNGANQCFQGSAPVDTLDFTSNPTLDMRLLDDRRVMPIAIVNCEAQGLSGGKTTFTPDGLAFVFLTEPMKSPSSSDIYVEVLGELDDSAKKEVTHDVIHIYRSGHT